VDREKQVGFLPVGNRGPLFERDVDVLAPGQDHLQPRLLLQQLLESQRDIQCQFSFVEPFYLRAWIMPPVSRVDHDARHAQSELARD